MGRSSPSAKSSYGHFYLFVRIKKETGRGSERPTGVRVVRDPEDVRSLGPELELEAPAGLGIHFHEEPVLRRSSEGHEPFGEIGRASCRERVEISVVADVLEIIEDVE